MALKLPQLIGHRGAASYAPENTLESIRTAADMGAKWVELDVKLTKDQIPIIFHDDDLDRTTNGSGPVMLRTYEEISQLEAGSWFGDSFAGIKIPTLEEAAEVIMELGLGLNLEIKPCPSREKETAEVALDYLSRMWEDHDKLLISSFSQVSLETARDIASDWKRGLLIDGDLPENWRELADYLDAASLNIGDKYTTRDVVEEIMNEDYPIAVWTINDPNRAHELLRWGVDSMFTDMPDLLEETLRKVH